MNGVSSLLQGKSVIVTGGARGLGAAFAHLDVTDVEQWQALVATTIAEFGSITALVHNAGISSASLVADEPLEHFRKVIDVNLIGVFIGMQAVILSMRRRFDREHLVGGRSCRAGTHLRAWRLEMGYEVCPRSRSSNWVPGGFASTPCIPALSIRR